MFKLKYGNIPIFIGKILLMILLNFFAGYILFAINLGYISLIFLSFYFFFNLFSLVISFTKKALNIFLRFDIILLIVFILTFIIFIVLSSIYIDEVEMNSHGALFTIPIFLSIICFLIMPFIDLIIIKKQK
jgi:hypothetical protein